MNASINRISTDALKSLLVVVLCVFNIVRVAAADDFLDVFSNGLPIVTSASRLSQSVLASPSAVTVIDSDMIQASGFIEFADILRLVPGFIVAHVDGGTQAVISHGEGWEYPNRMQLLIDGRSTYTNALSAIDWNTLGIHIEDIDRIEVVRGPAASAYGANSYSAAINVITKAPELDEKLSLRARYGNHGEEEWLLRHSAHYDNFSYRVSASTRENKGFKRYEGGEDILDTRDMNNLSTTASYVVNKKNKLWGSFSYNHGDVERATLADGFLDSKRQVDAWSLNLRWDHFLSETQQIEVNFFHNYLDEDDMALSYPLSELIGPNPFPDQQLTAGERSYHTHRTDIELQYSQVHPSGLQYVIGAATRYDTMKSEALFPLAGTHSNTGYRFFGNIQIPIHQFVTANMGALYEMNNTNKPHLSPRGSLNIHISELQTLRFGYSKAYRIPSLLEKHIDTGLYLNDATVLDQVYINSDDITAENVTSIDISYLGQLGAFPLSWEFRAYKEKYRDTIFFYHDHADNDLIDNELTRVDNAGFSNLYGFEGELTYRPERSSFIRLHFNIGHMTGQFLTDINREPPNTATQWLSLEDRAPKSSLGILAAKQWGSWQTNIGFYHVEEMKWNSAGSRVENYDRIDASIIKHIKLSNTQQLVLTIAGQNIGKSPIFEFNDSKSEGTEFGQKYYASIAFVYF